jgi:hypothetical protein
VITSSGCACDGCLKVVRKEGKLGALKAVGLRVVEWLRLVRKCQVLL